MSFQTRYDRVQNALQLALQQAGRREGEVRLIAVSKTVGVPEVREAFACGQHDFGENRIELLQEKVAALPEATWHFIGNVQSRKIAGIVSCSHLIHSVYQESHVGKVDAAAKACGKVQDILLEVNVSGEASKSGLAPQELPAMLQHCQDFDHVRVCGLMTMAPAGDLLAAERSFEGLRKLLEHTSCELDTQRRAAYSQLSMGMSDDWPQAVAQGATMVRIGRALFSKEFD